MVNGGSQNIDELRLSARELRQLARDALLPGYGEKMNRAAEHLEIRAAELEHQALELSERASWPLAASR